MLKKIIVSTISLFVFFALFTLSPVKALRLSVSPVSVSNYDLIPGSKSVYPITFSLGDMTEDMNISIITDFNGNDNWLSFDTGKEFLYSKGTESKVINITVDVPVNAELKNYLGYIRINAKKVSTSSDSTAVIGGTRLNIDITVTNKEVKSLLVTAVSINKPTISEQIILHTNIKNDGNVKLGITKAVLEIKDLNGTPIKTIEKTDFEQIDVFTTKFIDIKFNHELNPGEYLTQVKYFLDNTVIYDNKLILDIIKDDSILLLPTVSIDSNLSIVFIGVTIASFVLLYIVISKILKKEISKKTVIGVALIIPLLGLLFAVGFYSKKYFDLKSNIYEYNKVLGAWTTSKQNPDLFSLILGSSEQKVSVILPEDGPDNGKFNLYSQQDVKSDIVYVANGKEKLIVEEDKGDWLKINLGENKFGYLFKTSIK